MEGNKQGRERFFNKDHMFSIGWYPDIKTLYNDVIQRQMEALEVFNK